MLLFLNLGSSLNRLRLLTPTLLIMGFLGCSKMNTVHITGKVSPEIEGISIGQEPVELDTNGNFLVEKDLDVSTLLTLNVGETRYELFIQPGKELHLSIEPDTITFSGALSRENNHLIQDKEINEQISGYLEHNWYQLHRLEEAAYIHKIDSFKALYLSSMEDKALDQEFVAVNTASIHYAFDRLLLRYPTLHFYFTGEQNPLSEETIERIPSHHDRPASLPLESYQKFVKTWLDEQLKESVKEPDSLSYHGKVYLTTALDKIAKEFKSPLLRDFWSFEYIKSHIEQYTWINGKEFLESFLATCSTPSLAQQANSFKQELIKAREGHDIAVYKTVKGQKLEVHIFKPDGFDKQRTYPALAAFHGGGWISGNAGWAFGSTQHAAEMGMMGISVEYRLSNRGEVTPVEAMKDVQDAFIWVRKYADSLRIQPDKVVGKGISAGGHLVSAISILQTDQPQSRPNALVLVSPALDTSDEYFKSLVHTDTDPLSLSPIANLEAGKSIPPSLILQGVTDRLTPITYAERFTSKMDSLGYTCKLVLYENVGHLFTPSHLDDTGTPQPDPAIMEKAFEEEAYFLKTLGFVE